VVQTEKVGASQLPRLALATGQGTNSATSVEFRDASGKAIKTLLLGKPHMRSSGSLHRWTSSAVAAAVTRTVVT